VPPGALSASTPELGTETATYVPEARVPGQAWGEYVPDERCPPKVGRGDELLEARWGPAWVPCLSLPSCLGAGQCADIVGTYIHSCAEFASNIQCNHPSWNTGRGLLTAYHRTSTRQTANRTVHRVAGRAKQWARFKSSALLISVLSDGITCMALTAELACAACLGQTCTEHASALC
jgi:hypothetical protein